MRSREELALRGRVRLLRETMQRARLDYLQALLSLRSMQGNAAASDRITRQLTNLLNEQRPRKLRKMITERRASLHGEEIKTVVRTVERAGKTYQQETRGIGGDTPSHAKSRQTAVQRHHWRQAGQQAEKPRANPSLTNAEPVGFVHEIKD